MSPMTRLKSHGSKKKVFVLIGVIAAVAAVAVILAFLFTRVYQIGASVPTFTFSSEQAPGWWGAKNHNAQALFDEETYKGDTPKEKLSVAAINVFHGAGEGQSAPDNCFVMYSYYTYPLEDKAAAYTDYENAKDNNDPTTTLTTVNSSTQTLATPEGSVSFELRQYDLQMTGDTTSYQHGYEIGFVSLQNGYIRVEGVCSEASQLAATLPALSAVKLTN